MSETSGWRWPLVVLTIALAALGAAVFVFRGALGVPGTLFQDVQTVARAFREGRITTSFISYATEVQGTNYLQVATLKEMEIFERTDSASVLWGRLQLPDVVVRAEAPVEYTYYLDLDADWSFLIEDQAVLVVAPPIQSNMPAIDISAIRYQVREESLLRNEDEAIQNLQRGLTRLARGRAAENVKLVREISRKQTEEFVRTWLVSQYRDADAYRILVEFADERPPEVMETERR